MVNRKKRILVLVSLIILLIAANLLVGSQVMGEDQESADSSGFEALDAGMDTIDISKYDEEIQKKYALVKAKCAQCHSLARVINSDYALADEWKRYIKRMRRKPGAQIKKGDAKAIWEFLVYDSKQRKQELIKEKEAALKKEDEKK